METHLIKFIWRLSWPSFTLFNAHVKIAPPPTDPCLWIWEATRNCFLKHTSPWEGEAQVGMWRRWSPVSISHIVMPIPMLLSLQTTKASLSLSISACVCVCISMTELRLETTTTYKEWYIGIVNLCMQGVCFVNLGTCMVCVTHGMLICERNKSSWRILYFLLSSNTWEVRDGSELALMQLFYMQILTCKCKLCQ